MIVPGGADRDSAVAEALANQGARPIASAPFATTGLQWPVDPQSGAAEMVQRYNPAGDPTGGAGASALAASQETWNNVGSSNFTFIDGGVSSDCPSLVRQCKGPQVSDGHNDVGWLQIGGCCTLGVTWYPTSGTPEADMVLNTKFSWMIDGVNDYDVETVLLHALGHALGLAHSDVVGAVMEATYAGVRRTLHQDDINGITALYPSGPVNQAPSVTISSPADGSVYSSGATVSGAGSANDDEDGDVTSSIGWTSSIDGSIGSGANFSAALSDGVHTITASVTDLGGKPSTASITVTVGDQPVASIVSVTSITYATAGGRNSSKNLLITVALEDNLGNPVSGASVSISVDRDSSFYGTGTGSTGSGGTVTFNARNAPAGVYTTTITGISASGLSWDGATPPNSFNK